MKGWEVPCVSGDIDGKEPQGQKGISGSLYRASPHFVLKRLTGLASSWVCQCVQKTLGQGLFSVKANDQCFGVSKSGKFNSRQRSQKVSECISMLQGLTNLHFTGAIVQVRKKSILWTINSLA